MVFLVLEVYRPTFSVAKLGSSHTFTCPGAHVPTNKYKFYKSGIVGPRSLITPDIDVNSKQFDHLLIKSNLGFTDSGLYFCSVYDQNDKVVEKEIMIGILTVLP